MALYDFPAIPNDGAVRQCKLLSFKLFAFVKGENRENGDRGNDNFYTEFKPKGVKRVFKRGNEAFFPRKAKKGENTKSEDGKKDIIFGDFWADEQKGLFLVKNSSFVRENKDAIFCNK